MSPYEHDDDAGDDRTLPPEVIQPPVDKRVDSELAFHIEMRTRELIAQGIRPDEARRQAAERFGNLDQVAAELRRLERQTDRTVRHTRYVAELMHDWRFALRMIARRRSELTSAAARESSRRAKSGGRAQARNSPMSRASCSGCSSDGRCPHRSITASRAPGMRSR